MFSDTNNFEIRTFIFMDLETTDLFNDNPIDPLLNPNRCAEGAKACSQRFENLLRSDGNLLPKITEMAFITVPRLLFIEAQEKMNLQQLMEDGGGIEPVLIAGNVHVRQLNPQLSEQEWSKYEETQRQNKCVRLRRCDLTHKGTFGLEWAGVFHLLRSAPKPACLIAHNGVNFDFRLLYHELRRNNVAEDSWIPDQIFFLDSLHCFYQIEREYHREIELTMRNVDWKLVFSRVQTSIKHNSESKETNDVLLTSALNADSTQQTREELEFSTVQQQQPMEFYRMNRQQCTPPKNDKKSGNSKNATRKRALFREELHPIQFMSKSNWSPAKRRCIDPENFERNNCNHWSFNGDYVRRKMFGRGNFKLENMYKRIISSPLSFHHAQSDCEALLQICLSYGTDFRNYADRNCSSFPQCFRSLRSQTN